MRYLLDTNVVSAPLFEVAIQLWRIGPVPLTDPFIAATTVAEIQRGVTTLERSDPAQGGCCAAGSPARCPHPPLDDALIAAVAQADGLVVVTRNVRHFEPPGLRWSESFPASVRCLNRR